MLLDKSPKRPIVSTLKTLEITSTLLSFEQRQRNLIEIFNYGISRGRAAW